MIKLARFVPAIYVLLLAWLLIGPLWEQTGIPNSADGLLHLHRSSAVTRAWQTGVVWPRWFPDVYQGLGAPTFHYFSPLFYLMMAPPHLLGVPLDVSAKLIISGLFVVSGLATYAWLHRLFGHAAGLAGVALYLGQAAFFREYYVQGDYPQLVAMYLLPVMLWAFTRLYLDGGWPNRLLASLTLALVVVAHNVTALIGAGVLALYSLGLLMWRREVAGWFRGALAAVLGLGLSAFFWLPSVGDMDLVHASALTQGMFDYRQNFFPWQELFAAPPLLDGRAANPPFPHLLGWAAWLALAAGVVTLAAGLLRRSMRNRAHIWIATGLMIAGICLALSQEWTGPVWQAVPLLPLVLFPGRFLGPAALGVALTGGAAIAAQRAGRQVPLLLGAIAAVALTCSVFLFPQGPFVSVRFPSAADTQAYERQARVWGMTSASPFLPRWASLLDNNAGPAAPADPPAGATWTWQTPHRAVLQPATGSLLPAGLVVLPLYYFPAWQATADGSLVNLAPAADGRASLVLAQPAREVVLRWAGTDWQETGTWLSLTSLLATLVWIIWPARRRLEGGIHGAP